MLFEINKPSDGMWNLSGGPVEKDYMVVMIWLAVIVTILNWIIDFVMWLKS